MVPIFKIPYIQKWRWSVPFEKKKKRVYHRIKINNSNFPFPHFFAFPSSQYIPLILFTIAHRGSVLYVILPFGVKTIDLYFIISRL